MKIFVTSREGGGRPVAITGDRPPSRKATADRSIPATTDARLRRSSLRSRFGGVGGSRGGKLITFAINYQLSRQGLGAGVGRGEGGGGTGVMCGGGVGVGVAVALAVGSPVTSHS
ncbi:MAG: hypothetical protein DME94_06765 [Verrucomicrobia bacterium]|nr:MAG: hypothetical protein DME94_06765 [Verrucomicrobiota bacterium]